MLRLWDHFIEPVLDRPCSPCYMASMQLRVTAMNGKFLTRGAGDAGEAVFCISLTLLAREQCHLRDIIYLPNKLHNLYTAYYRLLNWRTPIACLFRGLRYANSHFSVWFSALAYGIPYGN